MMVTLIVSDLHLGARNSRTDNIADLLNTDFDSLILNGDTVDSPDSHRFQGSDWEVIQCLRTIARQRRLVVVQGNHDVLPGPSNARGSTGFLAALLQTPVVTEYELDVGAKRYLVVHGDQFDGTMNMTWLGDVADWCYRGIQQLSMPLAHWVKGASKHLCGVVEAVQRRGVEFARQRGYSGIIVGHTHFCRDEYLEDLHYLNTGCWVDWPCTYVRVSADVAVLCHWGQAAPQLVWQRASGACLSKS